MTTKDRTYTTTNPWLACYLTYVAGTDLISTKVFKKNTEKNLILSWRFNKTQRILEALEDYNQNPEQTLMPIVYVRKFMTDIKKTPNVETDV